MKKIFKTLFIISLFTSCRTTTNFYQVFKTVPSDKLISKDNTLFYEDANCIITYNLWSEGGNIGFKLFNKTDKNIYLHLDESFFILNGIAYDYYKNRIYSNSVNVGAAISNTISGSKSITGINYFNMLQTNKINASNSLGFSKTTGSTVEYIEEKTICIPPAASKIISEYLINKSFFNSCDLFKYPFSKNEMKTVNFTKPNSPFVFSNIITYSVGQTNTFSKIENEFYVSAIANYPNNVFIDYKPDEDCGTKNSNIQVPYFKFWSPSYFYIKYLYESNR